MIIVYYNGAFVGTYKKEKHVANWLFYTLWGFGLYALGGLLFLLWTRLDKDEDGKPFLNPKRLHYRITSSMLSRREKYYKTVGICSYYLRFVVMLFVGWPVVIIWQTVKTVVYAPFMFLFGYYPIPTFESMRNYGDPNPFAVEAEEIPLPQIGSARALPVYALVPMGYVCLFLLFDALVTLVWTLGIVLAVGLICLIGWFLSTDNQTVGLTREFISAKKKDFCIVLPIKEKGGNTP